MLTIKELEKMLKKQFPTQKLKVIRKETDKAFAISGDAIKDIFINMYKSVTEAAQTAKDKQVLAGSEVVESEKEQAAATIGSLIPKLEITAFEFKPSICRTYPLATVSGLFTAAVT